MLRDESQIFDKRFLYYYLSSKPTYEKLRSMAVGGVVNNLNSEMVRGVFVPVPDKVEQSGVADVLDKVKNIITLRKQEHQRLDELIKARFVEMFSNENCQRMQLDSLAFGKGEYGAQSASIVYDANRPRYVRITDINDDGSLNDDFVSSSNYADDEQYKLCYGDFLFARMGATVGKTYAYKSGNQIFAGYLIRYKLNTEKILPEYLFVYTKTEEYLNWVQLNQSGAAQPGINAKKYGSLLIPTPKIEKQKEFVSFVAQIDKSKVAVQKSLEETQLLFDKLMQEYFG
ncbi:MAG: restriction endonuclease subunit S [Succinimonas sp.]|nr:restriction endonuclease subunit S [Succinimonas sp.]